MEKKEFFGLQRFPSYEYHANRGDTKAGATAVWAVVESKYAVVWRVCETGRLRRARGMVAVKKDEVTD